MKNEVLLRYKRTRWHSVIRDSSIQRGGGPARHSRVPHRHSRVGGKPQGGRVTRAKQDNTNTRPVIADLIRNPEGQGQQQDNSNQPNPPLP